jgi:hypothetical protein
MGEYILASRSLRVKYEEKSQPEDLEIDRRILKCILKKQMGGADWIYPA